MDPYIVDIKRHSLEDGPGIRTVVFFKGCPLRCVFCQNPETRQAKPELCFTPAACIGCGACAAACPAAAIDLGLPGRIRREQCDVCGKCAAVCPGNGLRLIGKRYTVDALLAIVLRDRSYYRHSGGGVTLSGGECTLHPAYLERFLVRLKQEKIHVVLETSGHFNFEECEKMILPYVDLIYFDIKIMDSSAHQSATGHSNEVILENFRKLAKERPEKLQPRIPLVPGITAMENNLKAIALFIRETGARNPVLLPYNPCGISMYEKLGLTAPEISTSFMTVEEEQRQSVIFHT